VHIISDSKSAIQSISTCQRSLDETVQSIAKKIQQKSSNQKIHFQWIPSHVGFRQNDIADSLAKKGAQETTITGEHLTTNEIKSKTTQNKKKLWSRSISHDWYHPRKPGEVMGIELNRAEQTTLSRFRTGHLKGLTFEAGVKVFPTCPNCNQQPCSPHHVLKCLNLPVDYHINNPKTFIGRISQNRAFLDII
jgi:hypothetical protein